MTVTRSGAPNGGAAGGERSAQVARLALGQADEERRAALRRMRIIAAALLGFAAVVFVLTLHRDGPLGYVNATAEAAMVGALADWFAVTALFRHPLGIPIPHTALIPKRKDFFAKSLEDFVTGHFLTGEAARERFVSSAAVDRVGGWLAEPAHSARLVAEGSRLAGRILVRVKNDDVRYLVDHSLLPRLAKEPMSPIAGALLEQVVADRLHNGLVDILITEVHDWLLDNPRRFAEIVTDKVPTWAPAWLGDIVADRAHLEALRWVRQIRDDRDHRVRHAIDHLLADLAVNLQEDPQTMVRAEELKVRFLTHPQTSATALALWEILQRTVHTSLEDPQGLLRQRFTAEFVALGERLRTDEELREMVTRRGGDLLDYLVDTYAAELAPVISQVIARWDGKEAADRIELHVGRDLQFIRINGTLVGGLAGLLIYSASQLVGR